MKKIYRHGDILLIEVDNPEGEKIENRMLAAGEHSNHGHFITGKAVITQKDDNLFVRTFTGTLIRHLLIEQYKQGEEVWTKEHEDIVLPDNTTFKVIHQVEFDPYEKMIKKVQD